VSKQHVLLIRVLGADVSHSVLLLHFRCE